MTGFEPAGLDRAWAVLTPPAAQEFASFPLEVSFGGEPCRAALDRVGMRHLLVPASGEGVSVDDRPAVLGMALRRLVFGGPPVDYLDIWCQESELHGEFDEVLRDVLREVDNADRPASTAVRIVTRWRKLFRNLLVRDLSRPAKIGLFGELTFLRELLAIDRRFPVEDWRGPLKEPHDFEAFGGCVEVKALGSDGEVINVHGFAQLDTHDDRTLDLALLRVVDDPDGLSLGELVTRIEEMGAARQVLRSRLAAAGWHADVERPDLDTFAVQEVLRIRVDESTPRLVESTFVSGLIPEGVSDVRYDLDLAALLPHAQGASLNGMASEVLR